MSKVSSYEAKTHLSGLLKRTAKGEQITITKHGVSVAMLVPVRTSKKRSVRASIQEIMKFRKGKKLDGIDVKEMVAEGRRF
jgi:prevent-host-death family protein